MTSLTNLLVSVRCTKCGSDKQSERNEYSKRIIKSLNGKLMLEDNYFEEGATGSFIEIGYGKVKLDVSGFKEEIKECLQIVANRNKICLRFALTPEDEYDLKDDDPRFIHFCQKENHSEDKEDVTQDATLGYDILHFLADTSFASEVGTYAGDIQNDFELTDEKMDKMTSYPYLLKCAVEYGRQQAFDEIENWSRSRKRKAVTSESPKVPRKRVKADE